MAAVTSYCGWRDVEMLSNWMPLTQIDQRCREKSVTSRNVHSLIFVLNSTEKTAVVVLDYAKSS